MSTLPLYSPKFRAFDANGDPLNGGKLFSYAAGTSTPLATYTTWAGTIANANPVILDANGEADVWTTPGLLYKFVLKDSLDVIQWTVDNVPSGTSETPSADLATATEPGGRLTLQSGTPVTASGISTATTVFYVPYKHNKIPLYDGSAWTLHTIATELSQALSDTTKSPAAAVDGNEYDLFVWSDAGTLRLSRGPLWASDTSRGTGAGTTDLDRQDGRWVNEFAISNGPAARRGLYVGTIRMVAGGINDRNTFRHLWNMYNRVLRQMAVNEAATSWSYGTNTWRQANGNAANQLDFVVGLPEDAVRADVLVSVEHLGTGAGSHATPRVGIGVDSSTVNGALISAVGNHTAAAASTVSFLLTGTYQGYPGTGRHILTWMERGEQISGTTTWYGTAGSFIANSGITGHVFA